MDAAFYDSLSAAFAFVLGAAIGSFLNVCIYRLPRGLSINQPRRSFCPHCQRPIPWHHNLPLISWLLLRGRCAHCGGRIGFRYFVVELLTACLFLAVWRTQPWVLAVPLWVFVGLLIAATFIDFEHFIIPDEITVGGTVAGVLFSTAIPPLMGAGTHLGGLLESLAGAATGFFLLWGVVIAGKAAFGKKRVVFKEPAPFTWRRDGDTATLTTHGMAEPWHEFFPDERAVMRMQCAVLEIEGARFEEVEVASRYERLTVGGREFDLNRLETFSGKLRKVFFERDAMGFGDVKFLACIGAFLGWKAVLFTLVSASVVGAVVGVATLGLQRRGWSARLPFGPYLALGALGWLFTGPALVDWYWGLVVPIGR